MFTVTSHGLMMDGAPLTKSASRNFPPETLREIEGIEKMIKHVKKEDWDKPVLYAGGEYPPVVLAKMRAALLSPQPFPLVSSKPLVKVGFNPDEPRDERGRWTNEGITLASADAAHTSSSDISASQGQIIVAAAAKWEGTPYAPKGDAISGSRSGKWHCGRLLRERAFHLHRGGLSV
jgi:hypothetical protein